MDNNQKKQFIIVESRREIKEAVTEINAHTRHPLFGKFLEPIAKFINGFARKLFVLLEIQNDDIADLQKQLTDVRNQLNMESINVG